MMYVVVVKLGAWTTRCGGAVTRNSCVVVQKGSYHRVQSGTAGSRDSSRNKAETLWFLIYAANKLFSRSLEEGIFKDHMVKRLVIATTYLLHGHY